MFNPRRLVIARKRLRLSKKELADKIGVSPVTVTRIEKGQNEPEIHTVNQIVKVSGYPKEFFFQADIDELLKDGASFRSLSSMTAKERDAALASGSFAFLLADWVDERFKLPTPDLIDLGSQNTPSSAARSLRQYWGLGEKPIKHMLRLLESKGIRVFSLAEDTKNVDAFSCWRNDVPYVFMNTYKTSEHNRFDLAHELGHLVLHKHGAPQGREAEREADSFAASFLMPRSDVIATLPRIRSITQLVKAKRRWGVSLAALAYRAHKLGLITDWQHRSFCIQISRWGKKNEPEPMEREMSSVWKKVLNDLWLEKTTKAHIARSLHLPQGELENIIFGLANTNKNENGNQGKGLKLRLV